MVNAWPTSRLTFCSSDPWAAGCPSTDTLCPGGIEARTVTGLPRLPRTGESGTPGLLGGRSAGDAVILSPGAAAAVEWSPQPHAAKASPAVTVAPARSRRRRYVRSHVWRNKSREDNAVHLLLVVEEGNRRRLGPRRGRLAHERHQVGHAGRAAGRFHVPDAFGVRIQRVELGVESCKRAVHLGPPAVGCESGPSESTPLGMIRR